MSKFDDYSSLIRSLDNISGPNRTKGTVLYENGLLTIKKGVIYMPPFSGKTTIYNKVPFSVEIIDTDFLRYYYKALPDCYQHIDWLKYYQFVLTNRHEIKSDVAIRPARALLKEFIKQTTRVDKHLLKFQDDIFSHDNAYEYTELKYANETGICFQAMPLLKTALTSKRV